MEHLFADLHANDDDDDCRIHARYVKHDDVDDVRARAGENVERREQVKHQEEAIDKAGLDQKSENTLHAIRWATPSELGAHGSAVFPCLPSDERR